MNIVTDPIDQLISRYGNHNRINLNVANLGVLHTEISDVVNQFERKINGSGFISYRVRDLILEMNPFNEIDSPSYDLIPFYSSTLTLNIVIFGITQNLKRKPVVLIQEGEHIGVSSPSRAFGEVIEYDENFSEDLDKFKQKVSKCDVIIFSKNRYYDGKKENSSLIYKIAKETNEKIFVICDLAQTYGLEPIPFGDFDISYTSSHKWICGPGGFGLFWIKKNLMNIVKLGGDKFGDLSRVGGDDFIGYLSQALSHKMFFSNLEEIKEKYKFYNSLALNIFKKNKLLKYIHSDHPGYTILSTRNLNDAYRTYENILKDGCDIKFIADRHLFRITPMWHHSKDKVAEGFEKIDMISKK